MNTLQQKYNILSAARVGIEFEFFTEFKEKELTKSLSAFLGKKVLFPSTIVGMKKTVAAYHSDMEPTANIFKLESDFSGGKDMFEMITGPMVYEEARIIIIKMNQWIEEYGWTDKKCAIHLNASFDDSKLKTRIPLMHLNVLKFILAFDEKVVFRAFPNRKDSVYGKSIDNYYPINKFVFYDTPENIDKNDYVTPYEKYYGVNFTKLPKNYLEFRYLGGKDYEKKTRKILDILDYFINTLYTCLDQDGVYTPAEKTRLFKKLKWQKKAINSFNDYDTFLLNYPDILLTVDMNAEPEIIKAFWVSIRKVLFNLLVNSGMKKGHLNLDADVAQFQLKDSELKANHVNDLEIFDSKVSGTLEKCIFYRTEINTSRIEDCKLIADNKVTNSKVKNTSILRSNYLDDCYIENPTEIINGKINGGVIRKGMIGKDAVISKSTLIVDAVGTGKSGDKKDFDSYHDAFNSKHNFDKQ